MVGHVGGAQPRKMWAAADAFVLPSRSEGFSIDPATGTVTPLDHERAKNDPAYFLEEQDLVNRIGKVLTEANTADADLARAITAAGNATTGPAEDRPDVRAALSQPLPEDPEQFNDLWNKLTPEEKDWLYSRDHNLGNHPGMPVDPKDHLGKDHYNRRHLDELIPQQQTKVDQMQHQFDDLARKAYMGDTDAAAAASNLAPQLQAAKHQLDGYKQVHDAVDPPPTIDGKPNKDAQIPRYLGMLDEQGHAAVAVGGNPDTATRNATFVPGTGQDLARLEFSNEKAIAMYGAALDADSRLQTGDVSVTTWMGYDRPMDVPQAGDTAPATKIAAVERLGGKVVKTSVNEWAEIFRTREFPGMNGVFVHAFSDPDVIAGNGVIGLEILEDLPGVDTVLVPWGGGGLCCGIAAAIKAKKPLLQT